MRRFEVKRGRDVVPGVLWLPEDVREPVPLVLIGHGGSGHKLAKRPTELGRRFAAAGIAAAAIDGPYHGDRVDEPLDASVYQRLMAATGIEAVTDGMVEDWRATLDELSRLDAVDADRVGYLGFSMGTRFGLPYLAAAGSRLRCAVLGKYGLRQPDGMPAAIDMGPRFARDAPRVTLPLLFHVQWDDERFARDGQLALFDLLGSRDKRLIAYSGGHTTTPPEAVTAWCEFIAGRLSR